MPPRTRRFPNEFLRNETVRAQELQKTDRNYG
jgi:hypothetical protein